MPILLTPALHTTEQRRRHIMETLGTCKRLQIVSREVTNEWNFCKRMRTHSSKLNISSKQCERIRPPPSPAHWTLRVECMREPARTFFSLHRTSKRDDAQTRLSSASQAGF